jgi:hypothetical protein
VGEEEKVVFLMTQSMLILEGESERNADAQA